MSASSLSSFSGGVVVPREARSPFEQIDHGMERAGLVERRAEVAQRRIALAGQALAQRTDEARLADAGLARQQNDLALALTDPLPAVEQQRQLLLTTDERHQARAMQGLEAILRSACPRTRKRAIGSLKPARRRRPRSSTSNRRPRSRLVRSAITTCPGPASACRRAARFGVSPITSRSWASPEPTRSPMTTRPVAMPTRAANVWPSGDAGAPPRIA